MNQVAGNGRNLEAMPAQLQPGGDLRPAGERPVYWFDVPTGVHVPVIGEDGEPVMGEDGKPKTTYEPGLSDETGLKQIGLVELTAGEEVMAAKRCGGNQHKLAMELAKACLRRVNDRTVSTGDGTADLLWETMHPKARALVVSAYVELHNPTQKEVAGFLASRRVRA